MNRSRTFAALLCALLLISGAGLHAATAGEADRLVDYVDTLIGTGSNGHTFPGPSLPHGFVKLSPDTDQKSAGGYHFEGKIRYFSHNHISGMGGPKYGNVGVMPFVGPLNPARLGHLSGKADEIGRPGYYKVLLTEHNITAELTATMHAGMHRYTFPASAQSRILIDVGATLQGTGISWDSSVPNGGHVVVDPATREISGENSFVGGRASGPWKIYFVAKFDMAFATSGTWVDGAIQEGGTKAEGAFIGGYCGFTTTARQAVTVKVGLSFISVAQARENLDREIPHWDFAAVRKAASDTWESELSKIRVEGATVKDRRIFYTGLYHMLLMPTDFTGENPHFDFGRPYYDDFLCIWDLFRVSMPLHVLINPPRATDMLNSLLDVYRHDGWLPDSRCAVTYDQVQNGTNADVLFADASAKNLPGVDYALAAQAMMKHAEQPSTDPKHFGRAGITEYIARGYVPVGTKNAVSRTLEYVYDDFCIARVCERLGMKPEAERYRARASWYRNVWDPGSAFMRGRNVDGTWVEPFDPKKEESWGVSFYEGNAFQWGYYAPHDVGGLVQLYGGEKAFLARLDDMCTNYYAAWNEPNMLNPYLFPWVGRPDKTASHVRRIMQSYDVTPAGLPGNDDSGTTSGWYLWSAMGIYPVAGQDFYVIGSPLFSRVTIRLPDGRDFVIKAPTTSTENLYVQSGTLNGARHDQAFLRHADIVRGGTLELAMGSAPSTWATTTRPPSMSDDPSSPAAITYSPAQEIKLEQLELLASDRTGVRVREVLIGEVPGVVSESVAIVGPARHVQPPSTEENVLWFFLAGKGTLRVGERTFAIEEETIARAPLGWRAEIDVARGETLLALRIRKALNAEDRTELKTLTSFRAEPYVKTFRECTPYGEAIKSQRTVSRTLLPAGIVPRMAAGTVETVGPDQVLRHKHPMLEQFFVGLRDNDAAVSADDVRVDFPQFSILHIPLGSMHGAQVAAGKRLYYIWLDFFTTKEGQEWLKMHKPVTEEKPKSS